MQKKKKNPHSFLVNDTTLAPDNRLSFRQNLFRKYNNHDN